MPSSTPHPPLATLAGFAEELARESGERILELRRRGVQVSRKADSSPVTEADREAEALMRTRIQERFPADQVLGEEGGLSGPAEAVWRWVLDPIDGTRAFVAGLPLYGTLVALLENGQPRLGIIHLPAMGELMLGVHGAETRVNGQIVQVRESSALEQATLLFTDLGLLVRCGLGDALCRLASQAEQTRGWGDCCGHFLVAAGRADAMLDVQLHPWDVAALIPCVEGAGGRVSALLPQAQEEPYLRSALSSNAPLHDLLRSALRLPKLPVARQDQGA